MKSSKTIHVKRVSLHRNFALDRNDIFNIILYTQSTLAALGTADTIEVERILKVKVKII